MVLDNVTLVVKAPNQQIDDQNIDCDSSWSVSQLKAHLSQVYPSKPTTDEQKIIYSGQLLDDSIVLKDVLRTYEAQTTHTVHLVCTPKRFKMAEPTPKPSPVSETVTDGVRRRNVVADESSARVENTVRPEMRQNDQNHTVEMQNYLSSIVNNYGRVPPYPAAYPVGPGYLPVPTDPAAMANHMMMMQQAYFQYMQQYANMWQNGAPTMPAMNTVNEAPPQQVAPEPVAEPQDLEELDGEGGAPRDWLDWVYAGSRLAVLFSLVYLYSSPFRLVLVALLCACGYMYQLGLFRELGLDLGNNEAPIQRNNDGQAQRNNPVLPADQNRPADEVRQGPQTEPEANAETVADQNSNTENPNQQSLFAVTWMIFSTFFASLIPEN